jgi:DNA-directed RNA polymerase
LEKQKRAIRPNFIHTLDATTIALLFKNFDSKILYTVHDCFAVTADKVVGLKDQLKSIYLKMYTEDAYLLNFDKFVRDSIKNTDPNAFDQDEKNIIIIYKGKEKIVPFPDITKILKNNISNKDMYKLGKSFYIIN